MNSLSVGLLFISSLIFALASMKAELGKPSALQPDKGKVVVFVDCSPTTEPTFEANGSARVGLGGTDVIASVKAELGKPSAAV